MFEDSNIPLSGDLAKTDQGSVGGGTTPLVVDFPAQSPVVDDITANTEFITAPVVRDSEGPFNGLKWLAVISFVCAVPPVLFWFLSLGYVAGTPEPFVNTMTILPTWLTVVVVLGLPIMALTLALVVLIRTSIGGKGRVLAWLALMGSVSCVLGLVLWLIDDLINNS